MIELLPQVKEFKYLGGLVNKGGYDGEGNQNGCSISINADVVSDCCGAVKALDLSF